MNPWGEKRLDIRFAMLMALLANINRSPESAEYTPEDFMLNFQDEEESQPDWESLLAKAQMINVALGGVDNL